MQKEKKKNEIEHRETEGNKTEKRGDYNKKKEWLARVKKRVRVKGRKRG